MDTSSNDAIRFAHDDNYGASSSTNWYVLLFAVIITLFAVYWGFVRPTSRQLTKLRRYVTSLESSIADLNVQRARNGESVSMLEQMVHQEQTTNQATTALREMRELHRKMVQESEHLATAREALDRLGDLRTRVARQSTLIESTERALGSIDLLHSQVNDAATETEAAKLALEKVSLLRDGLIESINRLDAAEPITSRVEALHMRLTSTGEQLDTLFELSDTQLNSMSDLHNKIEAQSSTMQKAELTLDKMVTLQDGVLKQSETVAAAISTLELATDVELEMKRAGETFKGVKHMLTEMVMMKPALMQAMDSLQPIAELSNLRRLGVDELRRVANVISTRHSAIAHSIVDAETDFESVAPIYFTESEPTSSESVGDLDDSIVETDVSEVTSDHVEEELNRLVEDSLSAADVQDETEQVTDDSVSSEVEIVADASDTTVK